MARNSANSLLNSLKGKIWLATGALAVFVGAFGLVSYLLISFVVQETVYAVFLPFLFLSLVVLLFGWWLSAEVVNPIEKVGLLAKSLERSSLSSLPKTTGAAETDEILLTLHRNSQQLQNVIGLMDNVASGNLDVALTPLQASDKLSSSFQKLLAKVSDSINAKRDLEQLEKAIGQINEEIARVRKGNLNAKITSNYPQTREISETFRFLIVHLGDLVWQIRRDSSLVRSSSAETQTALQTVIRDGEYKMSEMSQTAELLRKIPHGVQKVSEELAGSIDFANHSIEKTRQTAQAAQDNLHAVGNLRKRLNDAISRIQRLGERSDEITKIAKTIEDLTQRTNLIALNASIQTAEGNGKGNGFAVLAQEVERLSGRAEETNKGISSLNQSIAAEIGDVENSLQTIVGDAAALSKFAVETGNTLDELERYIGRFLNLQTKLADYSRQQAADSNKSLQVFTDSVAVTEKSIFDLKQSEFNIVGLSGVMENLHSATIDFIVAEKIDAESSQARQTPAAEFEDFEKKFNLPAATTTANAAATTTTTAPENREEKI